MRSGTPAFRKRRRNPHGAPAHPARAACRAPPGTKVIQIPKKSNRPSARSVPGRRPPRFAAARSRRPHGGVHFPFLFSQFIFFPYICRGMPRTARAAHPPRIHETIPASAYRAAVADPGGPRRERTGFAAPDARPRHRGTESPHGPQGGAAPRAETAAGRARSRSGTATGSTTRSSTTTRRSSATRPRVTSTTTSASPKRWATSGCGPKAACGWPSSIPSRGCSCRLPTCSAPSTSGR